MSVVEISALTFAFAVLTAVVRWVWLISGKISTVEIKADEAAKHALVSVAEAKAIEKLLADHRQEVAKEYVSYQYMQNLETRVVDAIKSLGDRIDRLFSSRMHPA